MEKTSKLNYGHTDSVIKPRSFLRNNVDLWKTQFWEAWEPLPWDAKFAWIAFVSQTIAVITAIELFLLKK